MRGMVKFFSDVLSDGQVYRIIKTALLASCLCLAAALALLYSAGEGIRAFWEHNRLFSELMLLPRLFLLSALLLSAAAYRKEA